MDGLSVDLAAEATKADLQNIRAELDFVWAKAEK